MHKKYSFSYFAVAALIIFILVNGCEKDVVKAEMPESKSFTEEFDTVANLYSKGWIFNNNSKPQGDATWQQGIFGYVIDQKLGTISFEGFNAHSYKASANEYVLVGYTSATGFPTISSWMITPEIEMKNGDKISFYTRTSTANTLPQRLQIRLNGRDNSANVGFDTASVGGFTTLLGDINPAQNLGTGYPRTWTKYEYTISGLPAPLKRRIGFRYFVANATSSVLTANAIGIDQFEFTSL